MRTGEVERDVRRRLGQPLLEDHLVDDQLRDDRQRHPRCQQAVPAQPTGAPGAVEHLIDGFGGNQRQKERLLHVGDAGQAAEQAGNKPLARGSVVACRIKQDGEGRDGERREGVRVGGAEEDVRDQGSGEHHADRRQPGRARSEDRANESVEQDHSEQGVKERCRRERELIFGADIGVLVAGHDQ